MPGLKKVIAALELRRRILHILISLDQTLFVLITLGYASPDETISAWAWRAEMSGRRRGKVMRPIIDWLFSPFEKDHCYLSWLSEVLGKQLPPAYRRSFN